MQIQAIKNISFKGAEALNSEKKLTNKQQNTKQNIYTFVSKGIVYETRKMSEGREEKDGKYKLAELGTCVLSIGALAASLIKDAKAVKIDETVCLKRKGK